MVTYRPQVENLEDRCVPAVFLPQPGQPGPVTLSGTDGNDQFVVRHAPATWGSPVEQYQFSDDGGATFYTVAASLVTGIIVKGAGGDDRLTIDFSQGFVGKSPDQGGLNVSFDGGAGNDALVFTGQPPNSAPLKSSQQAQTSDQGTVQVTNGDQLLNVQYTSVEAVDFTVGTTSPTSKK